jgi:multidrug efflux pump subunit AcrB
VWIVALALRRKYTFIVMALLIAILGGLAIVRTPTDIFPVIDIPVVSVLWGYSGVSAKDMERRIVTLSERAYASNVNDIEHIESQSLAGVSVIKIYFQPGAEVQTGIAQISAISAGLVRFMPPGITAPFVIRFSASAVPIMQLGLSSPTLSEQQVNDLGNNFVRTPLSTVRGASVGYPLGGKQRQVMVDLDIPALQSRGLTPIDVSNAINAQNLILPSGSAKIGTREYSVFLNSSTETINALNNLPIKTTDGTTIYIRDVAHVHDGFAPQQNLVSQEGRRASLITIIKNGNASTLDVANRIKQAIPKVAATITSELKITPLFDQSGFVRNSIMGVVTEAAIAAVLTAMMILLFLGSLRSTFVVVVSIPLSILSSLIILSAIGQTINIMTLGGLALAVGILVDDATVEIENSNRNLSMGKGLKRAILDSAQQITGPTFVSTTCICIVFAPVIFLSGSANSLFTPLALAVVFAMLSSYLLSRTLVPVLVLLLLGKEVDRIRAAEAGHSIEEGVRHALSGRESRPHGAETANRYGPIWRLHIRFNAVFERLRAAYLRLLYKGMRKRRRVALVFGCFFVVVPFIGEDFFPTVDAGLIRLHVRAPAGTRLEETERRTREIEALIRRVIPRGEVELVSNIVGLPNGGVLANGDSMATGPASAEMLIALKEHKHGPTAKYVAELRRQLPEQFPDTDFFFQPADIVTQILNFGLSAPIDVQVVGRSPANYAIAQGLAQKFKGIPGAADVFLRQVVDAPSIDVTVDRERASAIGLTQRDVANNVLITLSGSGQTAPNYWLDPKNGVNYPIVTQAPQYRVNSMDDLANIPVTNPSEGGAPPLLNNLATVSRDTTVQNISHYDVQPVFDVFVNVQNRDLGGVSHDIQKVINGLKLPRGTTIQVRGQVESMNSSFIGLGFGLIFAIVLVYLLMVVNFQSWVDPFIIITALPGAISGILWMLYLTHTTFSVPALMGAIMCVGVASANSILVVTFANERRVEGDNAFHAALAAGYTRLRPVLMTASAMIIGMLPMALGFGEGGEQNAPLGRAVIGGLLLATVTTLLFVPIVYSFIHRNAGPIRPEPDENEGETAAWALRNGRGQPQSTGQRDAAPADRTGQSGWGESV